MSFPHLLIVSPANGFRSTRLRPGGGGVVTGPTSSGRARGEFGAQVENARRENALSNSKAARTVAGRSQDAQDCRLLLEMLGLDTGSAGARGPADE